MSRRKYCDHVWTDRRKVLHVCVRLKGHVNGCQCECGITDPGKPAQPPPAARHRDPDPNEGG